MTKRHSQEMHYIMSSTFLDSVIDEGNTNQFLITFHEEMQRQYGSGSKRELRLPMKIILMFQVFL